MNYSGQYARLRPRLDELMLATVDEEVDVELVNDEGKTVAVLYVDVLGDPVNRWTIRLRGWKWPMMLAPSNHATLGLV